MFNDCLMAELIYITLINLDCDLQKKCLILYIGLYKPDMDK